VSHELGLLARGIAPVYDPFCGCLIKASQCLRQQLINLGQISTLDRLSGALQESSQPRPDGDVSHSAFFRLFHLFNRRTVRWHMFDPFPGYREEVRNNPAHQPQYVSLWTNQDGFYQTTVGLSTGLEHTAIRIG
jgi:hypothetical protein